jgi:hypothetical protein
MNPEQIIYQRVPRATLLFQEFCDFELVDATMPRDLPYMANEQTTGFWGKDQAPTIFVGGRWAARASVKLPLDRRHARSIHLLSGKHRSLLAGFHPTGAGGPVGCGTGVGMSSGAGSSAGISGGIGSVLPGSGGTGPGSRGPDVGIILRSLSLSQERDARLSAGISSSLR